MEVFLTPEAWLGLLTLTFLEIVLGIDNIIFISIITNKLAEHQRPAARSLGLSLALIVRIGLLLCISWLVHLTTPLFTIWEHAFSARDIILGLGGLFLIGKSTTEIIGEVEHDNEKDKATKSRKIITMRGAVIQIIMIDIVFSFDSILTAVGLTDMIVVMIVAVILAMIVMIAFSGAISNFMKKYPSLEVLALGFLILIGFMLLLEGFHYDIPKGYIYFAVAFSLLIELTNIRVRKRRDLRSIKKAMIKQAA
jgi:predicted tellurium resistance membrane protein TerC